MAIKYSLAAMLASVQSFVFVAMLALATIVPTSSAALRELWRTGSTNTAEAHDYVVAAVAMDTNGNTIVAGQFLASPWVTLFVASFDAAGVKQWEYHGQPYFRVAVDALAVAPAGDIIVVALRTYDEMGGNSSMIRVADGNLLWERTEPGAFDSNPDDSVAKLRMDADGCVFMFSFDPTEQPPGHQQYAFLSKVDRYGHEVWRTRFPFIDIGTYYSPMPLALSVTGQPIITGVNQDSLPSVVCNVGPATGRVRWVRKLRGAVQNLVAVAAGPKSICVAGENGYMVFANGLRIAARRDYRFGGDRITTTRSGGFVILSPYGGYYATELSAGGRVKWRNPTGVVQTLGIFEDDGNGFVAVGPFANLLAFVRLNERGQEVSREVFEGYGYVSWNKKGTTALAAPDGTFRVVVNRTYYGLGFTIVGYGEQP